MNTELTKKEKNNFESDLFKLVNNVVFGKTIESVRKYQDIELVTKEETIFVSEPNYQTTILKKSNSNRNEKIQILMNKPVYFGLSVSEISKSVTYEFWYDYVKPKYNEKAKFCYMDTDSSI